MTAYPRRYGSTTPAEGLAEAGRMLVANPFLILCIGQLVIALTVGGASRNHLLPATIVELTSLVLLPWALYRLARYSHFGQIAWPLGILAALAAIPLLQLIPLPPAVWTTLPNGESIKQIYEAAGMPLSWRPISLAPDNTVRSALSLVTPISVFLSWSTFTQSERRLGVAAILAVTLLSLALGVAQVVTPSDRFGYLYDFTNLGSLVGFFANRNHEASLLLCAFPWLAAMIAADRKWLGGAPLGILCLMLTLTIVMALAAVRSRAGILLLGPSLLASVMIVMTAGKFRIPTRGTLIVAGLLACTLLAALQLGLAPVVARLDFRFDHEGRFLLATDVWKAALGQLPFGSGLGTFDSLYRSVERVETMDPAFLNHAHNDYLEVLLEAGLFGAALVLAFLVWAGARTWKVWFGYSDDDSTLAKAATAVIGVLTVHSLVDYPLRTLAMMSVFAFACALLVRPPRRGA